MRFRDRHEAGKHLARQLVSYAGDPKVWVLALPRGGVPVAFEVAQALAVPLDICVVRKLGVPGQPELAMGAIAAGEVRILNVALIQELGISEATIEAITQRELQELDRRERLYRGDRPPPHLEGQVVILIDDGLATGATMRAAIAVVQSAHPQRLVVAVPVAASAVCQELREQVDEVICTLIPPSLQAIGLWYDDFSQTSDAEVQRLLSLAMAYRQPLSPP
ncbi:phosphoribosyltransferase [Trichothermofontia sichuanensis B231]|uniref:phosphoribosyltransferase n=1 Tax=Trichothermofontia sichuanensis TaxID=3045816 RepID=UPI002247AC84|nr:phosphoribosyltransferase [Trichothermofontia sichuanensis]UZQ53295.1 phosphoribosyltransferase [Trichothermofontia sichuanensis B231]